MTTLHVESLWFKGMGSRLMQPPLIRMGVVQITVHILASQHGEAAAKMLVVVKP